MSERIWDGLRKNALYKSTYTLLYFTTTLKGWWVMATWWRYITCLRKTKDRSSSVRCWVPTERSSSTLECTRRRRAACPGRTTPYRSRVRTRSRWYSRGSGGRSRLPGRRASPAPRCCGGCRQRPAASREVDWCGGCRAQRRRSAAPSLCVGHDWTRFGERPTRRNYITDTPGLGPSPQQTTSEQ